MKKEKGNVVNNVLGFLKGRKMVYSTCEIGVLNTLSCFLKKQKNQMALLKVNQIMTTVIIMITKFTIINNTFGSTTLVAIKII